MKCVVGIDLGSTTTKAVLLDQAGGILGRGITNSRSDYEVACAVAREEALTAARFTRLERRLQELSGNGAPSAAPALEATFRLELYLDQLAELEREMLSLVGCRRSDSSGAESKAAGAPTEERRDAARRGVSGSAAPDAGLGAAVKEILSRAREEAPRLFRVDGKRRSDFFRDLAGAAFMTGAEQISARDGVSFDRLVGLFDRAILAVETRLASRAFEDLLGRAAERLLSDAASLPAAASAHSLLSQVVEQACSDPIQEMAFVGTGYGRQTLPFPKAAIRSEILCHGRGAHRLFPGTRTVLDIGGQDTKAIQVNEGGVVTSFQMNDRCAAGCGRYLGYIADELNLGLHQIGPLALKARRRVKVNSTCTVFAGAELRERLALGQRREDILAGLHRAMMLRAVSLLARSGGIRDQFTFTGGVCKNPMATRILAELVHEHYGQEVTINAHPDSIYMGALGAALFALDDLNAGRPSLLPKPNSEPAETSVS